MSGISDQALKLLLDELLAKGELIAGLAPLARLGVASLDASNEGNDFDGAEIADMAIRVGAVVHVPFNPDCHHDPEEEAIEGDDWAEYTPAVMAAKRWMEEGK